MKRQLLPLFTAIATCLPLSAADEKPLSVYSGDGVTVSVYFEDDDSGEIGGEVRLAGAVYPFTAATDESGNAIDGNLIVGGKSQPFTAKIAGKSVTFNTAGKSYGLREGVVPVAPASKTASARSPETMILKRVELRDVTMGGVVAHTMHIPADWNLQGHIEWSNDGTATWQNNFKVTGPNHEKIAAIPTMTFSYTEAQNGSMPPVGTPPPRDLGKWIVGLIQRTNPAVSEVRLLDDRRDAVGEAADLQQQHALGMKTPGMTSENHIIVIGYREAGVAMREEIHAKITRMPAIVNTNIRAQTWLLFTSLIIAAPEADFDRMQPQLLGIAGTRRMAPKWWNQMMQLRGEIMRMKAENINEAIRRRARMYDEMSDAQLAAWKRSDASNSEVQRKRIQGIYEVQDYRDRDGSAVELPFHHKHVFSDGRGNYVLTNDYNSKPGSAYEEIPAAD